MMARMLLSIFVQIVSSVAAFAAAALLLTVVGDSGRSVTPVLLLAMPFTFTLGIVFYHIFRPSEYVVGSIVLVLVLFYFVASFTEESFIRIISRSVFQKEFWSFIGEWYVPTALCIPLPTAVAFVATYIFKKHVVTQRPNGA